MQDFPLHGVYIETLSTNNIEMKTMKLWRIAFVMLAAFSLTSCSNDDDNDVYEAAELGGTWQKVRHHSLSHLHSNGCWASANFAQAR